MNGFVVLVLEVVEVEESVFAVFNEEEDGDVKSFGRTVEFRIGTAAVVVVVDGLDCFCLFKEVGAGF